MKKKEINWEKLVLFLVMAVFAIISFWGLGRDFLYDWDEGIYAQVARESRFSPILKWNQKLWFEKPPLVIWLVSLSFSFWGETELAARFFMPVFGLAALYFTYLLIKAKSDSKIALLSLTFFFFAPLFLARCRGLNTDIVLLGFTLASLYFLTKAENKLKEGESLNWLDYLSLVLPPALAVLAKGVLGFLPLVVWFIYSLLVDRKLLFKFYRTWLVIGLLVVVVIAPWHLYLLARFGNDFWQVYFNEHVLRRVTQPVEYHFGGKLYYIKLLIDEFRWWLIPIILGGAVSFWSVIKYRKDNRNLIFFLTWISLVFLIFTFSQTKLSWYILPLYPALAFFWANFWDEVFSSWKMAYGAVVILSVFLLVQKYQSGKEIGLHLPSAKVDLAIAAADICSSPLLFLVDQSERTARDILPLHLQLSSSFIYGGSPSVVFYYQDRVDFFYDLDQFYYRLFESDLSSVNQSCCAIISREDYRALDLSWPIIKQNDQWLLIK